MCSQKDVWKHPYGAFLARPQKVSFSQLTSRHETCRTGAINAIAFRGHDSKDIETNSLFDGMVYESAGAG